MQHIKCKCMPIYDRTKYKHTFKTKKTCGIRSSHVSPELYQEKYHKIAKMSRAFLFPTYTNLSPTYFSIIFTALI